MNLKKMMRPLVIVFALLTALLTAFKLTAGKTSIDFDLLIAGNALFFLVNLLVLIMQKKAWENPNPHAFLRAVTGGMMIKMLVCAALIIAYVLLNDGGYTISSILLTLAIYVVYLVIEVRAVSSLNKRNHVEKRGRP